MARRSAHQWPGPSVPRNPKSGPRAGRQTPRSRSAWRPGTGRSPRSAPAMWGCRAGTAAAGHRSAGSTAAPRWPPGRWTSGSRPLPAARRPCSRSRRPRGCPGPCGRPADPRPGAAQAERERGVLAGVDHHRAAADLADRGVDPMVVTHVVGQGGLQPAAQRRGGEHGQEPGPVHLGPQPGDVVHVHPVPAAKGGLANLPPERARGERLAAAAALVIANAAQPHVHDLTSRAGTGHLAEQPLQQGATAAAEAGQVDHPRASRDDAGARRAGERARGQRIWAQRIPAQLTTSIVSSCTAGGRSRPGCRVPHGLVPFRLSLAIQSPALVTSMSSAPRPRPRVGF